MNIVHTCVQDLVDFSLIPYSGWNWDTARDPIGKPAIAKWNVELRNIAGLCHLRERRVKSTFRIH